MESKHLYHMYFHVRSFYCALLVCVHMLVSILRPCIIFPICKVQVSPTPLLFFHFPGYYCIFSFCVRTFRFFICLIYLFFLYFEIGVYTNSGKVEISDTELFSIIKIETACHTVQVFYVFQCCFQSFLTCVYLIDSSFCSFL